jgi:hypothetical protein
MTEQVHHHHEHHDHGASDQTPAAGSYLLAMSASRRLGYAALVLVALWGCVSWAMSQDESQRPLAGAGVPR